MKAFGLDWLMPVPFKEFTAREAHNLQARESALIVDIREVGEREKNLPPNDCHACSLSDQQFDAKILDLAQGNPQKTVILCCHAGNRSKEAAFRLQRNGLQDVATLQGGIIAWKNAGLPVAAAEGNRQGP